MTIIGVVLLVAQSRATFLVACNATPGAIYPKVVGEYETKSVPVDQLMSSIRSSPRRTRRQYDDPGWTHRYAVHDLDFDDSEAPVTSTQRRIIYDAHRFMMLVYSLNDADESPVGVRVVTTAEIPTDARVGMWNGVEVVLYINVIHSLDLLFLITVHEYLHRLAFSHVDAGFGSFPSRTNDTTLEHSGPSVDDCFADRGAAGTRIYTDAYQYHWKLDTAPFSSDVMEPVLPASGIDISPCTLAAVVDTRPSWSTMTCRTTADCPTNYTCYNIGPHLGNLCLVTEPKSAVDSTSVPPQYPVFSAYLYAVVIIFVVLYQCAAMPQNKKSMLAHLLVDPLKQPDS